jgi:hypothetical protein
MLNVFFSFNKVSLFDYSDRLHICANNGPTISQYTLSSNINECARNAVIEDVDLRNNSEIISTYDFI